MYFQQMFTEYLLREKHRKFQWQNTIARVLQSTYNDLTQYRRRGLKYK